MLKESLRAAHGVKTIHVEESPDHVSLEIQKTCDGLMVQIPAPHWMVLTNMTIAQFAEHARKLDLSRDPESKRGPKKSLPNRGSHHNGGLVSTSRGLAKRKFLT